MRKARKRVGFSLVEVLVLLLITTIILSAAGLGSSALIVRSWEVSAKGELSNMADQMKEDITKYGFLYASELKDDEKREAYFERMGESFAIQLFDVSTLYYVSHEMGEAFDDFYFGADYDGVEIETKNRDPWDTPYRVYYLASTTDDSVCVVFVSAGSDKEFSERSESGYVGYADGEDIGDDLLVFLNRPIYW